MLYEILIVRKIRDEPQHFLLNNNVLDYEPKHTHNLE